MEGVGGGAPDAHRTVAELPRPLSAAFQSDFAYETVKDRLPVIVTSVVDELYRDRETLIREFGEESRERIKAVIGRLSRLKNDIQTDKSIAPIEDDREDSGSWNECIRQETTETGAEASWFKSAWLLVECYMYRKIQEAFELSGVMKMFDPFAKQKELALINSLEAIKTLSLFLEKALEVEPTDSDEPSSLFVQLMQVDLWGNRCDLSISAGRENPQLSDPVAQLDNLRANILVDDTELVWRSLRLARATRGDHVRVDIVMDNAGFELFVDLCLADYLLAARLASRVVFHVKPMPWFVSDTTPRDLEWTLRTLRDSPVQQLSRTGCRWQGHLDSGAWLVRTDAFWTLPHDMDAMQRVAPKLYTDLSASSLLLFKGDLNYRKLTGDRKWDLTVPFSEALRGFRPTCLCTLRTIKADVVVGLSPGQAEATRQLPDRWMVGGDFAVIQYFAPP